ncbi:MAG TPA: hypothetical protein PK507_01230 [bacterium]|nr:hypothetical protein [bacterium]
MGCIIWFSSIIVSIIISGVIVSKFVDINNKDKNDEMIEVKNLFNDTSLF